MTLTCDYECDCETCKHITKYEFEEPCVKCKNNFVAGTESFESAPLLWEQASVVNDPVNHPSHYTQGGIECIDAMVAAFGKDAVEQFCICNAFKYVWRSKLKNGIQDIEKAHWYLNKYKELIESE